MTFLIVVAVVILVAVVGYYGYLAEKKRREVLAAFAAKLGWRFSPVKDREHDVERRRVFVYSADACRPTSSPASPAISISATETCCSSSRARESTCRSKRAAPDPSWH